MAWRKCDSFTSVTTAYCQAGGCVYRWKKIIGAAGNAPNIISILLVREMKRAAAWAH